MTTAEKTLADDDGLDPSETRVFLSYSRIDREQAQRIADVLRERSFGVFRDTDDILPTEEWRDRLQQLIEEADTIVFLMSPHSIASEVCAWEVDLATSLNKRIAPIVIEDVDTSLIPPALAKLNFIFCTARDPFDNAVGTLISALNTDVDWIREHTRLATLARRWRKAGSAKRLLLRGEDIADAETWRDSRPAEAPAITPDQATFIADSRRAATARQRQWIGGSLTLTVAAAALAVFAYFQSVEADNQRALADAKRIEAEAERAAALRSQTAFLTRTAQVAREEGNAARALAFAMRGLPPANDLAQRPVTNGALFEVRQSLTALREIRSVPFDGDFAGGALHPDGTEALVIPSGRLERWDLSLNAAPEVVMGDGSEVYRIAYSPSGDAAAYITRGGDIGVMLDTGQQLGPYPSVAGFVDGFAVSDGGKLVYVARREDEVFAHDMADNGATRPLTSGLGAISRKDVAFTLDGAHFLVGSFGGLLKLFETRTGAMLAEFQTEDNLINALALTRVDDQLIGAFASINGLVIVYDARTGANISTLQSDSFVSALAFADGGKRLIVGNSGGAVSEWDIALRKRITDYGIHNANIGQIIIGADGSHFLTTDGTRRLKLWKRGTEGAIDALFPPPGITHQRLAVGPITSAAKERSTFIARHDGNWPVRLQTPDGQLRAIGADRNGQPTVTAFSQNGLRVAVFDNEQYLTLWNTETGGLIREYDAAGLSAQDLQFTPDARSVMMQLYDGRVVQLWLTDGALINFGDRYLRGDFAYNAEGTAMVLAGNSTNRPQAMTIVGGALQPGAKSPSLAEDMTWASTISPDGTLAASGLEKGAIIWNTATGAVIHRLEGKGLFRADALKFSGDGAYLISASNRFLRAWDVNSGQPIAYRKLEGLIHQVATSADGGLFATRHDGGQVMVWALPGATPHAQFSTVLRKADMSYSLSEAMLADDKNYIFSADSMDFSADGQTLITKVRDVYQFWDMRRDAGDLIAEAADISRDLTPLSAADECTYGFRDETDCRNIAATE